MSDELYLMSDGWYVMSYNWCVMGDEWLVVGYGWWEMSYDWWVIDGNGDERWVIINEWLVMSYWWCVMGDGGWVKIEECRLIDDGLWLVKIDERRLAVDDCLWYSIGNGYSIISVEWREIGAG